LQVRDWDIVTPPGSPTHFKDFCDMAGIIARPEVHKLPLLPPATPGAQVVPFRAVGEQVIRCQSRASSYLVLNFLKFALITHIYATSQ
jgi:hypothetical protein